MKGVKVLKFGGTSMGSASAMGKVIAVVAKPQQDAHIAAVVVSAMSGVTNSLIESARSARKKDATYKKSLKELKRRHIATVVELVGAREAKKSLERLEELFKHLESVLVGIF